MQTPKNMLIMDAYNANPSSMEAAITNFAEGNYDNKMLLLGEMRELGPASEQEHARIIDLASQLGFNRVYLVGKSFHITGDERFKTFASTDDLMDYLRKQPLAGYTILIKGSRGNKLETVMNYL
jgi:UDP-N-acetylmuramoyl-tripeptide--D-alanyl-D-alanine ligase